MRRPSLAGTGTGNEGKIRSGDERAASLLHGRRRLLPRRDHADHPVGRVHALRAQQRLVMARAGGRAADDLVLVPLRRALLSRKPAHRRRRHPDDAGRQDEDRDRLADRAVHDGHQPVHVLVGHQALPDHVVSVDLRFSLVFGRLVLSAGADRRSDHGAVRDRAAVGLEPVREARPTTPSRKSAPSKPPWTCSS